MNHPISARELLARSQSRPPVCVRRGSEIVLTTGIAGYEYAIESTRCASPQAVIHWVMHLSEKTWVTTRHLRQFIQCAYAANNLGNPWEAR